MTPFRQFLGSGEFFAILPATTPILNSKQTKNYSRLLLCLCATMHRTHIFYLFLCKRNAASNLCHEKAIVMTTITLLMFFNFDRLFSLDCDPSQFAMTVSSCQVYTGALAE